MFVLDFNGSAFEIYEKIKAANMVGEVKYPDENLLISRQF